jgi:hypothetical protein
LAFTQDIWGNDIRSQEDFQKFLRFADVGIFPNFSGKSEGAEGAKYRLKVVIKLKVNYGFALVYKIL